MDPLDGHRIHLFDSLACIDRIIDSGAALSLVGTIVGEDSGGVYHADLLRDDVEFQLSTWT